LQTTAHRAAADPGTHAPQQASPERGKYHQEPASPLEDSRSIPRSQYPATKTPEGNEPEARDWTQGSWQRTAPSFPWWNPEYSDNRVFASQNQRRYRLPRSQECV